MINRIRDIRKQKSMTLAEVAAACDPPTTAQTIGRLETGMRNLSLTWMNKIAAALGVDPELLVKGGYRDTSRKMWHEMFQQSEGAIKEIHPDLDVFSDSGAALSIGGGAGGFDFDVTTNAGVLVCNAGPAAV